MASAACSRGASSTEPPSVTTLASMPAPASRAATVRGYDVAMRLPARSASVAIGAPSGDRECEPAAPEAQLEQRLHVRAGLDDLVLARDAEVDVAGGGPHRDVVGARQQQVDVEVVSVRVQRPARRLELDAGVGEQPHRRLGEAALRRQGEAQQPAAGHDRFRARRSSTSR